MNLIKVYVGVCLLIFFLTPLFAQSPTNSEKKLSEIEKKIEENNKKILPKKIRKKAVEKDLSIIARQLRYTKLKLQRNKLELKKAKNNEVKTKQRLSQLESMYKKREEQFKKRLVEIYKVRNLGFIEFLFSSTNFSTQTDTAFYFDRIIHNDINMIHALKKEFSNVKKEKERLQIQTKKISSLRSDIVKQEQYLKKETQKKERIVTSLQSQIRHIEQQNIELEEASQELTSFIMKQSGGQKVYHIEGAFIRPVKGWISSRFGYRTHPIFKRRIKHNGVDFAAPTGYKIKAANSGYVIVAGQKKQYKGYGKIVVIDHGRRPSDNKNIATFYAHQSRILVKEGQFVKKGQEIGWVGATGYATGPHLHFEIRINGVPTDPLKYIK
jgi:murein DD-endopeptidase MepM/ murein hydrolase activator NlpD